MEWRSRIAVDPGIAGGKPFIRGTRISVESIVDLLAAGWTRAQVLEGFPYVSEQDIHACLAYAADVLRDDPANRLVPDTRAASKVSMEPMKVALRVLTAIAEKQTPATSDIDVLVRLAGPKPAGTSLDEFACEALQHVMRDRAEARKAITVG